MIRVDIVAWASVIVTWRELPTCVVHGNLEWLSEERLGHGRAEHAAAEVGMMLNEHDDMPRPPRHSTDRPTTTDA